MRSYLIIGAMLLSANSALAQSYQPYPPPQQEANVTSYPVATVTYPQTYNPRPQPVQNYNVPQPSDAGQSVVNDIRQMNF